LFVKEEKRWVLWTQILILIWPHYSF
jgi:hypothetical protein